MSEEASLVITSLVIIKNVAMETVTVFQGDTTARGVCTDVWTRPLSAQLVRK